MPIYCRCMLVEPEGVHKLERDAIERAKTRLAGGEGVRNVW